MENERNIDTLQTALSRLPSYAPPVEVWEQLHARINNATEAPVRNSAMQFRAPASAWDKIDEELDFNKTEKNREHLKQALALLPEYRAPERVWMELRHVMEQGAARVRYLPHRRSVFSQMAAVAAVVLLFGGSWWMTDYYQRLPVSEMNTRQQIQIDQVDILYSEENMHAEFGPETITLEASTEPLAPALSLEENPGQRVDLPEVWRRSSDPAMQALVAEWDELTAAQQRIRETIGAYNDDPRWVLLLTDMERSRARLAKEMLKAQ